MILVFEISAFQPRANCQFGLSFIRVISFFVKLTQLLLGAVNIYCYCSLFVVCSCLTCMCYLPIIIIVCYDYYRIAPDEYSTLSANKKQKSKRNNVEIEIMSKSSASELSARKKVNKHFLLKLSLLYTHTHTVLVFARVRYFCFVIDYMLHVSFHPSQNQSMLKVSKSFCFICGLKTMQKHVFDRQLESHLRSV